MPSFETHMEGHAANLVKAITGDVWRDHFRAEFAGAFENLGVPAELAGRALAEMMVMVDAALPPRVSDERARAAAHAIMKIFSDTCRGLAASAT